MQGYYDTSIGWLLLLKILLDKDVAPLPFEAIVRDAKNIILDKDVRCSQPARMCMAPDAEQFNHVVNQMSPSLGDPWCL